MAMVPDRHEAVGPRAMSGRAKRAPARPKRFTRRDATERLEQTAITFHQKK